MLFAYRYRAVRALERDAAKNTSYLRISSRVHRYEQRERKALSDRWDKCLESQTNWISLHDASGRQESSNRQRAKPHTTMSSDISMYVYVTSTTRKDIGRPDTTHRRDWAVECVDSYCYQALYCDLLVKTARHDANRRH